MNQKEIEQYLIDFQNREFPSSVERTLKILSGRKINAIMGPRRAGKTTFLHQIMKGFVNSGKKKRDIIYFNLENTRLFDLQFKEVKQVIEMHKRLFPSPETPILFFDEPQNVSLWEKAVRELYDDGYLIFLTGSSSKLLSREIATSLRGRSLNYLLLPFSFKEFLKLKGLSSSNLISSDEKTKILVLLDEYMKFGGFPEIILEENKDLKLKILENYFDLTIYKDIIERHGIKDSMLIKWFIKSLISNYTREISINKLYLTLKSQNRKISKDEIYSFASMCNDSFFMMYLPKFSWSARKRESTGKVYLCDTIFSKITETTEDTGKKMENLVFLELTRRLKPFIELSFWKNVQHEEVDFVVKEGPKITRLIQVCKDLSDAKTKEREIRALLKASKELNCKDLFIMTEDYEAEEETEWYGIKRRILFVPIWKWLLEED